MFILAWSLTQAVAARDIKVAFDQDKAPYVWVEGGQVKGIEVDIVSAALAVSGDNIVPTLLPNRRVAVALADGSADAITGVQEGQVGEVFYSDIYLIYTNVAATRKVKGIKLDGLPDIFGYSVAAWQKAWEDLELGRLHPAGPGDLSYTEFTSQYRQAKFFWAGRADIDIVDRNIFLWYAHRLAREMDTSAEITFHEILPSLGVRAAFRYAADRDAFNAGLKKIQASGQIDRIYDKYGLR